MSVVCAALAVNAGAAERIPDACRLLSRAEIQGAIGGTATGFEHATTSVMARPRSARGAWAARP
jgi:hypothetical protein